MVKVVIEEFDVFFYVSLLAAVYSQSSAMPSKSLCYRRTNTATVLQTSTSAPPQRRLRVITVVVVGILRAASAVNVTARVIRVPAVQKVNTFTHS